MIFSFYAKLDIPKETYRRFIRIADHQFKNGVFQSKYEVKKSLYNFKAKEKEDHFLLTLCAFGLMGFQVTSWGMEESEFYLTEFGKEVRRNYSV